MVDKQSASCYYVKKQNALCFLPEFRKGEIFYENTSIFTIGKE